MACDVNDLLEKACENKFTCLPDEKSRDVVLAQLLCDLKDAIETLVESIPKN